MPGQRDLSVNLSALSTDIVSGRNEPAGTDNHGSLVSGVIAAEVNDFGTIGVAYNASIISIRADISDCTDPDDTSCFRASDLANSLDYAVANGARIINLSLGGEGRLGTAFENAMQRAVNAGVVFAIASGNEAVETPSTAANPQWPGRYASDPRFAGSVIVVGAHDANNIMTDFSNRAGVSASTYLSGPGRDIITGCDGTSCFRASGTSFSSPAVAGALALLLEAFPNLTGRDAVNILLTSARDAGDAGTDVVYGRGLLDIARAFQPIGTTSSPQSSGASVTVVTEPGSYIGGPFGDAIRRTGALQTIGYDSFDRLFRLNLGSAFPTAPRRSYQPETPVASRTTQLALAGPDGTRFSLMASAPVQDDLSFERWSPFNAPWTGAEPRRETMLNVTAGRYGFATWQGQGGARSPFHSASGDSFAALAQADQAMRGTVSFGPVSISAETGTGDRQAFLRSIERDASTYSRATLNWAGSRGRLSLSAGSLDEKLGPLGAYMPVGSDFVLPSQTGFAAFGGDLKITDTVWLTGEFGMGRTEIDGRVLDLDGAAISSNWRIGLISDCPSWALGCSRLTWSISQPLRIESGSFTARLADVPLEYFDPVTYSDRRFSASPSGRQIDLSLRSLHPLGDGSVFQLEAVATRDEQHRRDAAAAYALLGSWRRGF